MNAFASWGVLSSLCGFALCGAACGKNVDEVEGLHCRVMAEDSFGISRLGCARDADADIRIAVVAHTVRSLQIQESCEVIHANQDIYRDIMFILHGTHSLRCWYATTRKALRSREDCLAVYMKLAMGDLAHCSDIMSAVPIAQLNRMGFLVEQLHSASYAKKLTMKSPLVVAQNDLASLLYKYRFQLLQIRLQQLCLFMFVPPYNTVLLAHSDIEVPWQRDFVASLHRRAQDVFCCLEWYFFSHSTTLT